MKCAPSWIGCECTTVSTDHHKRAAFYGLDLYSLYTSIREVLRYLDKIDPETAEIARQRYGCLTPWQTDPAAYGHATLSRAYRTCEKDVVRMLKEILTKQNLYTARDGEQFIDAVHNARLVASAERYYRIMYYGSRASWNLRDSHMFETLQALLAFHGRDSKAIVWAHNSHVGDASATEMSARGEYNIGELCRKEFGDKVYIDRIWYACGQRRGGFRLGWTHGDQDRTAVPQEEL